MCLNLGRPSSEIFIPTPIFDVLVIFSFTKYFKDRRKQSSRYYTASWRVNNIHWCSLALATKVASRLSEVFPSRHSTCPYNFFSWNLSSMDSSNMKLESLSPSSLYLSKFSETILCTLKLVSGSSENDIIVIVLMNGN